MGDFIWNPEKQWSLQAGFLVSEVLEVVHNGMDIALLDTSLDLSYAGRIGNALSPSCKGQRTSGGKGIYRKTGKYYLSCR